MKDPAFHFAELQEEQWVSHHQESPLEHQEELQEDRLDVTQNEHLNKLWVHLTVLQNVRLEEAEHLRRITN